MILAHVSDTHVGSDHDAALAAALAALPAALDSVQPAPDLLLITGDLTDHGAADEYRRLSALLEPLGA